MPHRLAPLLILCACLVAGPAAEPFAFSDDFTRHAAGGDGSPAWDSDGMRWIMGAGVFSTTGPDRELAFPAQAPRGDRVTVQGDCTVRSATGTGWKLAGVCVADDERNYWHLALVEGPDDQGRKRFVELSEMLDGTWLAQGQAATRLAATDSQGFAWEPGRRYRLRLDLGATGVQGQVLEADGTVRARLGWAFAQAKAVRSGRPGLTSAALHADFHGFSTRVDGILPPLTPPVPAYDGRRFAQATITGKATGFIHVERIDGRWWAVDPLGKAFFIIGTDHANYQVHWCEKLGYAPYHRNVAKKFGGEAPWADSVLARLDAWGFNSLGTNPSRSITRRGLPHPEFLSFGSDFAAIDPITPRTTWTGFPNVFSPQWPAFCAKQARKRCAPYRNDPWIIGYFIDNELEWHPNTSVGILGDTWAKPAGHSAKQALVGLLRQRHGGIAAFNAAWGTALASFAELPGLTKAPAAHTVAAQADERAFLRLAAERYFGTAAAAIRAVDPNHMILGCRFAGQTPDILDIAGKHSDVFTINCYRTIDLEKGVLADGFEQELDRWHRETGRPMIITEWSFPALDAGLPCRNGAGQRVPTQADKAFCFTVFQKLLLSTPFMVGSNYFMWVDEPALGISSTFPEDSNYGLVDERDGTYELLTRAATRLHAHAETIHAGRMADLVVEAQTDGRGFTITNRGTVAGAATVRIWSDGQERSERLALAPGQQRTCAMDGTILARPGAHIGVCTLDLDAPLLQRSPGRPGAWTATVTPGLPWPAAAAQATARTTLALVNPSERVLERQVVAVPWDGLGLGDAATVHIAVCDEAGRVLPAQLDRLDGGAELAIAIDRLAPRAGRTVTVYAGMQAPALPDAVACRREGNGFAIDNGALALVKSAAPGGTLIDHIRLGGLDHGRFAPLLHQRIGSNRWTPPQRIAAMAVSNGPVRLVVDMTAEAAGDLPFRAGLRLMIEPGRPWFSCRCRWIENTGATPWELASYYLQVSSLLGAQAAVRGDRWSDPAADRCIGVVASAPFAVTFWQDPQGHGHPDTYRACNQMLAPGQRQDFTDPAMRVAVGTESGWQALKDGMQRGGHPTCHIFTAERR